MSTIQRLKWLLRQPFFIWKAGVNFAFIQGLLITFQTNITQRKLRQLCFTGLVCFPFWLRPTANTKRGGLNFTSLYLTVEWGLVGLWVICEKEANSFCWLEYSLSRTHSLEPVGIIDTLLLPAPRFWESLFPGNTFSVQSLEISFPSLSHMLCCFCQKILFKMVLHWSDFRQLLAFYYFLTYFRQEHS